MQLVNPTVRQYFQDPGIEGMYKAIQRAAHVCYCSGEWEGNKFIPKVTDHARSFVEDLISRGHMRPLEFGTVYLYLTGPDIMNKYIGNPYSKVRAIGATYYITTNYRVLVENGWLDDLKYWSEPTEYHSIRYTFHWSISRGIADEFRTHVSLSSQMMSTRYCNFASNKFGSIRYSEPSWFFTKNRIDRFLFKTFYRLEEKLYMHFIKRGWQAQEAREILSLGLRTEFVQCAYLEDWSHFLDLRLYETTGKAHPDAKNIAWYIAFKLKDILPLKPPYHALNK